MKDNKRIILSAFAIPLVWMFSLKLFFLLPISIPINLQWYIVGIIGTLLALFITAQVSKYNEVSLSEVGLNWTSQTPKRLFGGLVIGAAIASVMLLIIVQLTGLEVNKIEGANILIILFYLLAFLPMSFMEEVAFRGFVFFKLEKIIGLRSALIITSVLFAYYHDASGATFIQQLLGPGIWGIIYGFSAIWSKGLALPTGIHAGVNMVLASLGLKESFYAIGMVDYPSEVTESIKAHTEMVGLSTQLVLLIIGILITEWYLRRRKTVSSHDRLQ